MRRPLPTRGKAESAEVIVTFPTLTSIPMLVQAVGVGGSHLAALPTGRPVVHGAAPVPRRRLLAVGQRIILWRKSKGLRGAGRGLFRHPLG
jgi:hypothetical protein